MPLRLFCRCQGASPCFRDHVERNSVKRLELNQGEAVLQCIYWLVGAIKLSQFERQESDEPHRVALFHQNCEDSVEIVLARWIIETYPVRLRMEALWEP